MTYKEISELLRLVKKLEFGEFKLEDGEFKLSIRSKEHFESKFKNSGQQMMPVQHHPPAAPASPAAVPPPVADLPPTTPDEGNKKMGADDEGKYLQIKSPIVGTFYRSPSPDKPIYVKVGDTIEVGAVVCIVEAMKLFNEIESEISGKIVKVLVEDASPVEYNQVLFLVDPKG